MEQEIHKMHIAYADPSRLIEWNETAPPSKYHQFAMEGNFIYLPDSVQAILIAGNMLVLIMAFCGNIAALTIVAKAKISKKTTKCFLATLAISDLIYIMSAAPIDLGLLTDKRQLWVFGKFICQTISSVQIHSVIMNALCLFGIAFERYLCVIRSPKLTKISQFWETRIPYAILILCWLLPFGASIVMLNSFRMWTVWILIPLNGTLYRDDITYYTCRTIAEFPWRTQMWSVLLFVYILLLFGFILCYGSIIYFVQDRSAHFSKANTSAQQNNTTTTTGNNNVTTTITVPIETNNSSFMTTANKTCNSTPSAAATSKGIISPRKQHGRTIRLIMSLILLFLICRTPVMIFNLVANIKSVPQTVFMNSLFYFLHLLSNVNTVISPFLYAVWNNALRSTGRTGGGGDHLTLNNNTNDNCFSCCTFRNENGKTRFTNATSSVINALKFKRNSFSFNSRNSKIFPSGTTQKYISTTDRNDIVQQRVTIVSSTVI